MHFGSQAFLCLSGISLRQTNKTQTATTREKGNKEKEAGNANDIKEKGRKSEAKYEEQSNQV